LEGLVVAAQVSEQAPLPLGDSEREESIVVAPFCPDYSIAIHIAVQRHNLQLYLPAIGNLQTQVSTQVDVVQLSAIQRYRLRDFSIGWRLLLTIELLYGVDESLLPMQRSQPKQREHNEGTT
jgi:hypothetical protein